MSFSSKQVETTRSRRICCRAGAVRHDTPGPGKLPGLPVQGIGARIDHCWLHHSSL